MTDTGLYCSLPVTRLLPDGRGSPRRGRAGTLLTRCTHSAPDVAEQMATDSINSPVIVKGKVKSQVQGQPVKFKQFRNQLENRCNYSKVQEGDEGPGLSLEPLGHGQRVWEGVLHEDAQSN